LPDSSQDQGFREEAERLSQLPRDLQKAIIAMHRLDADNPKAPKRDRDFAQKRAAALETHLRTLNKKKKQL
jgi:hypothetical protein